MSKLMEAQDKVRELSLKALGYTEDTTLTALEQKSALDQIEPDIKKWTDEVQALQQVEETRKRFANVTGQELEQAAAAQALDGMKSVGTQFVNSKNYKDLVERGMKGNWTSGQVELKTTLTEGTAAAPGGGYAPVSAQANLLPGVLPILFRKLTIADLFPQGTTDAPLIRYLLETATTNAAASVVEGNLKPESAIAFGKVDEVLHKIATFLPVSDEMLEDWSQIMSYLDARLNLFVKQSEEAQLLSGDGTGANLVGLLNRPGLASPIVRGTAPSVAGDNQMDTVYRQITQIRTTAFLEPDAIVIDPIGWQDIILSKNAQGAYYANGPFVGQQPETLWGKAVVNTPAMAQGTALVGAFQQGGQIFRKGGLVVEASNSHADFFQRNLTAIRAEERLALAVYRPGAFGLVSGL